MMSRSVHYFGQDGQFGHAEGIQIIETDDWTEDDWFMLVETAPSERAAFALDIANWIRLGRPDDYWTIDYHVAAKYKEPESPKLF